MDVENAKTKTPIITRWFNFKVNLSDLNKII